VRKTKSFKLTANSSILLQYKNRPGGRKKLNIKVAHKKSKKNPADEAGFKL